MDSNSLNVLFSSVPGRYARALFNECRRLNCFDDVLENFHKLEVFLKNHQDMKKILTSHSFNNRKEIDGAWIVLGGHLSFHPIFTSFMREIGHNKRFDSLNKIMSIFEKAVYHLKNKRNVTVSSAVELLPEEKIKIESIISRLFSERSIISYKVSPKLLGGFKIYSDSKIFDASVLSQLKQVSKYLSNIKIKGYEK